MRKKILTMDEVRPGMFVTIYKGKKTFRPVRTPEGEQILSRENDMYKGKILEILSVDMPYAVVIVYHNRPPIGGRERELAKDVLDLREITLMRLEKHYIQALIPGLEIQEDHFWDDIRDTSLEDADTTIEEIFKDL